MSIKNCFSFVEHLESVDRFCPPNCDLGDTEGRGCQILDLVGQQKIGYRISIRKGKKFNKQLFEEGQEFDLRGNQLVESRLPPKTSQIFFFMTAQIPKTATAQTPVNLF